MSTPEQNRQTIIDAYACLKSGDEAGFYDKFSDDACLVEASSLPYGGVYRGIAELKYGVDRMFAAWPEMRFSFETITAGGDLCFVHIFTSHTARSGMSTAFPVLEMWRFREDGKVVELRPIYWDTHRSREVYGI